MNTFNIIENQIQDLLSSFKFELASLYIDQFLEMHSQPDGTYDEFVQSYIRELLIEMRGKVRQSESLSKQADQPETVQIKFLEEIKKLNQQYKIDDKSMDWTFGFTDHELMANLEDKENFITRIINISKNTEPYVCRYSNPSELPIEQLFNMNYILVFPLVYEESKFYNAMKFEYLNGISSSLLNLHPSDPTKKILFAYEFLERFDDVNKLRFYGSFIRNFLLLKYYNYDIQLENISILLSSEHNVNLFNSALKYFEQLLAYNQTIDSVYSKNFFENHPYTIKGKLGADKYEDIFLGGPSGSIGVSVYSDILKKNFTKKIISARKIEEDKKEESILRELYNQNDLHKDRIVTEDPVYRKELAMIYSVKDLPHNILLLGESGVGKTEIANIIHSSTESVNKSKKLVTVNCAAIPPELIESELFGYAKGAHSTAREKFEGKIKLADEGTLFLDEIGKAPLNVQAKLLKFVDEKTYYSVGSNVEKKSTTRIIFATNEDPIKLIKQGAMLADFYFRISKLKFTIPPLRERKKDLKNFILYFKNKCEKDFKISLQIRDETLYDMINLQWPGNIRQVENTMYQTVMECKNHNSTEIQFALVKKHIDIIPVKTNYGVFTNFEESFRSFFEYWKSIKNEFGVIKIEKAKEKTNEASVSGRKNKSNNSHSFLKLIIEPMAAQTFHSMNIDVNKSSEILGISLGQGEKYSPLQDRLNLYPKIKKVFEKLEN